jgi:hypothetical protein
MTGEAGRGFREGKSRMVQRQQQRMGEPSEREHYSLYCWIYLQGSAYQLSRFGVRSNLKSYLTSLRLAVFIRMDCLSMYLCVCDIKGIEGIKVFI